MPGFRVAWSGSPGCGAARPQGGDIPGERGSEGFRPELPVLGFLSPGAGRGREVLAGWCRDLNCPVSAQVGSRGPSSGASRSQHTLPWGHVRSRLTPSAVRALVSHLSPRCWRWRWGQGFSCAGRAGFPTFIPRRQRPCHRKPPTGLDPARCGRGFGWVEIREAWAEKPSRHDAV